LDNQPISESIKNKIKKFILSYKNNNAVIFSDFRHGIFNKSSIEFFANAIPKKIVKIADSQVASRWGNITEFKNFDLITPNEREARFSLADQDSSISHLSRKLLDKTECKNLILKLGNKGLFSVFKNKKDEQSFHISSFANRVVDPVGSGDALLAYSTLALLASHSLVEASIIGAIAAACECELDGNIPISLDNVIKKINDIEKNSQYQIK
jgi:bifunctional ADP-heptose synthase (sugar kinase/adenylyltransferase)